MKMQRQPNRWSCIPTAFAMVIDVNVLDLINQIGHDGSEIIRPNSPEPLKRRGFHPQEIINLCFTMSHAVIPFETELSISDGKTVTSLGSKLAFTLRVMKENEGAIIGRTLSGKRHAVAWNGKKIYDPNGAIYFLDQFIIDVFYLITPINLV